jgi:hypothetical protein
MSLDERLRRGLRAAAHEAPVDPDGDVAAGRRRVAGRRRRARLVTGAVVTVLVVAAAVTATQWADDGPIDDPTIVGDEGATVEHPPSPPERSAGPAPTGAPGDDRPPPVRVSAGDRSLELDAFTYCSTNVCVDGMPPEPLPDIGEAGEVRVDFALPDWTFQAELVTGGQDCGRRETIDLEATGDGTHVLRPAGPAGTYDVFLAGEGGGDAHYAFRWTTTTDGPMAAPSARMAVLADHDGVVDSYGVELHLQHLAATPAAAAATVTVRAADGAEHTFPAPGEPSRCPEGSLYWTGSLDKGLAAAALADGATVADAGPFTYEVLLTLDGVEHRATATWPDDMIVGNEPSVALAFTPALPAAPSP